MLSDDETGGSGGPNGVPIDGDTAANVLLLEGENPETAMRCLEFLLVDDPAVLNVLFIEFDIGVAERVRRWVDEVGWMSPRLRVILVGGDEPDDPTRVGEDGLSFRPAVETVPDPGNLAGLGSTVLDTVGRWRGSERTTVICFHSLSTLLETGAPKPVFQFIHLLSRFLAREGAVAHYHARVPAGDEEAGPDSIRSFTPLFDLVAVHDADGGLVVSDPVAPSASVF